MSSVHRDILASLARLRTGATALSSEEYVCLLDAVEQAAEALALAPRGGDAVTIGLWYNHERAPALARLADALHPPRGASGQTKLLAEQRDSDAAAARALQQSLANDPRR